MVPTFERKEALITASNISKSFGSKLILRDIGVGDDPFVISNIRRPDMQQGQTVAMIGESGSGKTTFFKLLSGILEPSTGSITIPHFKDGEVLEYVPIQAGDVGMVQQTYPLSRNQSVYQMLYDAARQGCVPKKEQKEKIDEYLNNWNLWNQRFLSANGLSGGQRQRVAIIEQLLCSSHFIIFDEPFSGLDVKNIEDVKKSFKKITTTDEINTIIFSTHDIHLAVELADSIYVMGYEKNSEGSRLPGGTIVKKYDLKETGLAWSEIYTPAHNELAQEIISMIKTH
jgi:ABC-type multidrug transport system ATPase subunit